MIKPETVEAILEGLAEGEGLSAVCKRLSIARRTVRWWQEQNVEFAARIKVARQHGLEVLADQIISIGDEVEGCVDNAVVQAAKVRIDARKWVLARLHPEQWGDRVAITGKDGKDLLPAVPEVLVPRLMQVLAVLLPGTANSELHSLASTMVGRLNGAQGALAGPGEGEDGAAD